MRDDFNKQQERCAKALRGEEGTAPQSRVKVNAVKPVPESKGKCVCVLYRIV